MYPRRFERTDRLEDYRAPDGTMSTLEGVAGHFSGSGFGRSLLLHGKGDTRVRSFEPFNKGPLIFVSALLMLMGLAVDYS